MTSGDLEYEFYRNMDQESLIVRGSVVAPAAAGIVASMAAPPAGVYEITVLARYGAVADAVDNMDLRFGGVAAIMLPVLPIVNAEPIPITIRRRLTGSQSVTVCATAAGAATSVYIAHMIITKIGD